MKREFGDKKGRKYSKAATKKQFTIQGDDFFEAASAAAPCWQQYELQAATFELARIQALLERMRAVQPLVKLAEDVCILIYMVRKADSITDLGVAVGIFVKLQCASQPLLFHTYVLDTLSAIIGDDTLHIQADSDNIIQTTRDTTDKLKGFLNSNMTHKLKKLVLSCVTMGIFDASKIDHRLFPATLQELERASEKSPASLDFVLNIFDTILFVIERVYTVAMTGNISSFFHGGDSYHAWAAECAQLERMSHLLNDPTPHGFSEPEFTKRLDDAISRGREISGLLSHTDGASKRAAATLQMQMLKLRDTLIVKRAASEFRPAPCPILLNGKSCIGKTTLIWIIFYYTASLLGLPNDKQHAYFKNGFAKFWDGFKTWMWFLVIDDIAFMKDQMAQSMGGDPSVMEVIQINNSANYVPDQAALEDKGKVPLRNRITLATTNTKHLNAQHFFQYPAAVQRRFPYIVNVTVKAEYATQAMLDKNKIPEGTDLPDYWIFSVETVRGFKSGTDDLEWNTPVIYTNVHEFLRWLGQTVRDWEANQKMCNSAVDRMVELAVCQDCLKFECSCEYEAEECEACGLEPCACFEGRPLSRETSTSQYSLQADGLPIHEPRFDEWRRAYEEQHAQTPSEESVRSEVHRQMDMQTVASGACVICERYACNCGLTWREWMLVRLWQPTRNFWTEALEEHVWVWICAAAGFSRWLAVKVFAGRAYAAICWTTMQTYFGLRWINPAIGQWFFDWYLIVIAPCLLRCPAFWRKLGATMERRIGVPIWVPTAITGLSMITLGIYVWHKMKPSVDLQGNEFSSEIGTRPVKSPTDEEKANVYYTNKFVVSHMDVTKATVTRKSWTKSDVVEKVRKHLVFIDATVELNGFKHHTRSRGTMIGGQVMMMSDHCLPTGARLTLTFNHQEGQVSENCVYDPCESDIFRHRNRDVAFVRVRCSRFFRNIDDWFRQSSYEGRSGGFMIGRSQTEETTMRPFDRMTAVKPVLPLPLFTNAVWCASTGVPTQSGDCGSLYFQMSGLGPVIVGQHIAGSGEKMACTVLDSEFVNSGLVHFDPFKLQQGPVFLDAQLVPLHEKSPIRFFSEGRAYVFGTLPEYQTSRGSQFTETILSAPLKRRGWKLKHGAPVMSGWKPKRIAYDQWLAPQTTGIDLEALDAIADAFADDIFERLTPDDISKIHLVDVHTALNGAEGIPFMERIKLSTSAGYPYRKPKRTFFEETSEGLKLTDAQIEARLDEALEACCNGEIPEFVYDCALKDEPTTFKKMAEARTRVFNMSSLESTIIGRMLFMGLGRVIPGNFETFETVIGMNCASAQWGRAFAHLTSKTGTARRKMAGDYKFYDKSTPVYFTLAAVRCILRLVEKVGWSQRDRILMKAWLSSVCFAILNMFGDVLCVPKGNPSGCAITTLLNSMVNSLLFRYTFVKTWSAPVVDVYAVARKFKDNVALYTLGDDNVADIAHGCNLSHLTMNKVLAEFGMTYTMAEKDAELVDYISMEEVTFLKRRWVFDERIQDYAAPLEWASIEKMLMCCTKTKAYEPKIHAEEAISAALRYAWDHGEEKFNQLTATLREIVDELDLHSVLLPSTFPTAERLLADWIRSSKQELARQGRQPPNAPEPQELSSEEEPLVLQNQTTVVSQLQTAGEEQWELVDDRAQTDEHQAMREFLANLPDNVSESSDEMSLEEAVALLDDVNFDDDAVPSVNPYEQNPFLAVHEVFLETVENIVALIRRTNPEGHELLPAYDLFPNIFVQAECFCPECFTIEGHSLMEIMGSCSVCVRTLSALRLCWMPGHLGEPLHTTWRAVTAIDPLFASRFESGFLLALQRAGDPGGPF